MKASKGLDLDSQMWDNSNAIEMCIENDSLELLKDLIVSEELRKFNDGKKLPSHV